MFLVIPYSNCFQIPIFVRLFTKTMRNILIIGAGRSASSLIQYLLKKSRQENLHLTIADLSLELAQKKNQQS